MRDTLKNIEMLAKTAKEELNTFLNSYAKAHAARWDALRGGDDSDAAREFINAVETFTGLTNDWGSLAADLCIFEDLTAAEVSINLGDYEYKWLYQKW